VDKLLELLKKYWWIILIVVGIGVVVFIIIKNRSSQAVKLFWAGMRGQFKAELEKQGLLDLWPDWSDPAAVRKWLTKVVDLLRAMTGITPTEIDNKLVGLVARFASDEQLFLTLYDLIKAILDRGGDPVIVQQDPRLATQAAALAEVVGIDPVTLLTLLSLAVKVGLAIWKLRKN